MPEISRFFAKKVSDLFIPSLPTAFTAVGSENYT